MTRRAERVLADLFVDAESRRFGTGWISGTLSVALGLLAVIAVLCLHFPDWLTLPELRERYPLPLVRTAIDLGILTTFILAGLSLLLRRRKALGIAGLALGALALVLGAGGVEISRSGAGQVYLGLDWFVLGTLTTAALFVPLERWRPLRAEQGPFRAGWLTDAEYFFASHALVQLMSVLVMLPAVRLGSALAIPELSALVQAARWRCSSWLAC
jgi:lathosterol oxidase